MTSPFTSELQVTGSQETRIEYITQGLEAVKAKLVELGASHTEVTTVEGTKPEGVDGLLFDVQVLAHELFALSDSMEAKPVETPGGTA